MIQLSEVEVAALQKFKKQVSEAYPAAQYGAPRRGAGSALELDVIISETGLVGDEPVQAAANDVLVADGVYIVPHVSPRSPGRAEAPLDRLRGSVKSFYRPFDPADD